jgi:hypothetical protein
MPITSDLVTIYHLPDGATETLRADLARNRVYFQPYEWSLVKPPPPGWDRIVPRYRVTRDVQPAEKSRFRSEPPFTEIWSGAWQYGERPYQAGEEIETTAWPHPSFMPLNFSAERVLEFFKASMKSRLTTAPWHDGRVRLDNGLTGPLPNVVSTPQIQRVNLRPVA